MLSVETAETILSEKQADLKQLTSQSENDQQHLIDEQKKLHQEIKSLQQKREGALPPITADSLKVFTALRPRKNNQPIALLVNGSCSVCRVEQDMAIIGEVRKGQKLTPCTSCGRILVYKSG
jgi:predicted  nucleic acid-binding Zn-ribbon protein